MDALGGPGRQWTRLHDPLGDTSCVFSAQPRKYNSPKPVTSVVDGGMANVLHVRPDLVLPTSHDGDGDCAEGLIALAQMDVRNWQDPRLSRLATWMNMTTISEGRPRMHSVLAFQNSAPKPQHMGCGEHRAVAQDKVLSVNGIAAHLPLQVVVTLKVGRGKDQPRTHLVQPVNKAEAVLRQMVDGVLVLRKQLTHERGQQVEPRDRCDWNAKFRHIVNIGLPASWLADDDESWCPECQRRQGITQW